MKTVFWIAGVLLALAVLFLLLIRSRPKRRRPPVSFLLGRQFAHRGLHTATVPENSLRAFAAAAERGLGIELDLQLSKDGRVVVFHDFSLLRVTGLDRKVCELTAEELGRVSLSGCPDGIPTLEQVLDTVAGRVPLIIELKIPGMNLAVCPKAFELLDRYDGPFCVESFHPLALNWLRRHRPQVVRGQLSMDFFAQHEQGSALQFFVVKNLLLNFLAQPDFIAFDLRNPHAAAFTLCRRVWGAIPVAWTVRSDAELQAAKTLFAAWICEDIYERDEPETASGAIPPKEC